MAEKMTEIRIEPEVAGHLAAAMDQPAVPGPTAIAVGMAMAGERHWPDGMGKKRHPKENNPMHGRAGHEAAVNAVHRTGRPQMPHSS